MMELLSTRQAAERLGVAVWTLNRAVWLGQLSAPQRGPGGAFYWLPEDVERASWHFHRRPYRPQTAKGGR